MLASGTLLKGRYRVDSLLGQGGMAEVYRAWDAARSYPVAIKVLRPELAEDREFEHWFQREADSLARLQHRNIVRFYSFEREGRLAFIVMDYVEGVTLRAHIFDAHGPLPLAGALDIVKQVASALYYAHQEGIIHRDVKPANIMFQPDGRALLSDFGIAKAVGATTMTMGTSGTPAYMSPEQWLGKPVDHRADIYALGVVAYEMLAGRRPFVGDSPDAGGGLTQDRMRWEHLSGAVPALRQFNPHVSPALEQAVTRALAKDPNQRWPTAMAFWQAIATASGLAGELHGEPGAGVPNLAALPSGIPANGSSALRPGVAVAQADARGRGRVPAAAWAAAGIVALGLLAGGIVIFGRDGKPATGAPTATSLALASAATAQGPEDTPTDQLAVAPLLLGNTGAALISTTVPTDTPAPSATAALTASLSATAALTGSLSATAAPTAALSATTAPTGSLSSTAALTDSLSATAALTGSLSTTAARTASPSATATPTASPSATPTAPPSATATPTASPSATPTASPSATSTLAPDATPMAGPIVLPSGPSVSASSPVNVRSGPGTDYPILGQLAAGSSSDIIASDVTGDWLEINFFGQAGWVDAAIVAVTGDLSNVPVVSEAPPPATMVPPSATAPAFATQIATTRPTRTPKPTHTPTPPPTAAPTPGPTPTPAVHIPIHPFPPIELTAIIKVP